MQRPTDRPKAGGDHRVRIGAYGSRDPSGQSGRRELVIGKQYEGGAESIENRRLGIYWAELRPQPSSDRRGPHPVQPTGRALSNRRASGSCSRQCRARKHGIRRRRRRQISECGSRQHGVGQAVHHAADEALRGSYHGRRLEVEPDLIRCREGGDDDLKTLERECVRR